MEKKEKGKMGKIADFRSKSINPSKNNFLTSHQIFFFCGSPPKWTYMGELKIPSSGRVSRFAEFFTIFSVIFFWKTIRILYNLSLIKINEKSCYCPILVHISFSFMCLSVNWRSRNNFLCNITGHHGYSLSKFDHNCSPSANLVLL